MFLIFCPYCGEHREQAEFDASGESHLARPQDPDNCSDEQWGEYLYFRKNPQGIHRELWVHAAGCRKYFTVVRDTVSYEIYATYRTGEKPDMSVLLAPDSVMPTDDTGSLIKAKAKAKANGGKRG